MSEVSGIFFAHLSTIIQMRTCDLDPGLTGHKSRGKGLVQEQEE